MAAIRYVFLSDLHFAEHNGILTDPMGLEVEAPLVLNEAFAGLVACLLDIARSNTDGIRPRLVLLGDIFELALAPYHVAFEEFALFVSALFPEGAEPLFDPRIVFVPGNHDHALWTSTRDELLGLQLARREGRLQPTAPVTTMFDLLSPQGDGQSVEPARSVILTELLQHRLPYRSDLEVQVAYPNLGITDGERVVVAHHGHFMDEVYVLMSTLSRSVFGGRSVVRIDQLEADNGAWIDFVWSSLGREGALASGLRRSYDLLQSDSGKVLLASRLAAALATWAPGELGRGLLQRTLMPVLMRLMDGIETSDVRRSLPTTTRVPDEVLGYIDGPLADAIEGELVERDVKPERYTFIYGHTHRPLAQLAHLPRRRKQAEIFNSGGWVVDTQMPRPATSGGIVLVDEHLETVLLRIGAQVLEPHLEPVRVECCDGSAGELARQLEALVRRPDGPWHQAARALGSAVLRRRAEHGARLINELQQLDGFERLALRSEYIWKLLARRRARMERDFRSLFTLDGSDSPRRTRWFLRRRSPLALPPQSLQPGPAGG